MLQYVPYADLHVHTTNSDGSLVLDDVPAAARRADVDAVAITDHDRLHPDLDAPVTEIDGIEVVHGIELRVETAVQRVDLLGYGITPTDDLAAELARLQEDRIGRGRTIIERVEDALRVDLDLEPRAGLGRPHIARAVVDHDATDYDEIGRVFADLIGNDASCYVARDVTDFETGVDLLSDACGIVGLAHPLRYDDPEHALDLCADLDAVERDYPYDRPVGQDADLADLSLVDDAIDRHDLLRTGGSDAHGTELGKAGLDLDTYERVRSRLPPVP